MKTSIIIPTYNRSSKLEGLLKSLEQTVSESQIIVVDDQSTDDTEEVVKQFDVEYTKSPGEGQLKAKGVGIELADGEIIGFLEDDMIVTDGYLEPVIQAFEAGEKVVQSKVVFQDHELEPVDKDPDTLVEYRWNFNHITKWHYGSTGQHIPFGLESGRFVHHSVLDEVPIVDPNLCGPGFGESISFSFRAQEQGYQIYFEPNSVILHIGADDGGSSDRFEKNLLTNGCSKFEYYRFHNSMYLHSRFAPEYILPGFIYHIIYTAIARAYSSGDMSCIPTISRGLFYGIFTELSRKARLLK